MKKKLTNERKQELAKKVAELRRELEKLPVDRQDAFNKVLDEETRKPPSRAKQGVTERDQE